MVEDHGFDLRQAAKELGINVPIVATRLVGSRLELHLYGGRVVDWHPGMDPKESGSGQCGVQVEPAESAEQKENPEEDVEVNELEGLKRLKVSELRAMAAELGLEGVKGLRKAELVATIRRTEAIRRVEATRQAGHEDHARGAV